MNKQELFEYLESSANEMGLDPIAAHGFLTATVVGKPLPNWISAFLKVQMRKCQMRSNQH